MNNLTQVPVKQGDVTQARTIPSMFGSLQREIDRVFEDFTPSFFGGRTVSGVPVRMDLAETKDGFELLVEVPGLEQKDVEVEVRDNVLTVSGERKFATEQSDKSWRFVERSYGAFSRSIVLPDGVKADRITAALDKGVLKLTIPTPAKAEARKIEVKAIH